MSHYTKISVAFTSREALRKALIEIGYDPTQVEVHQNPVQLKDFANRLSKSRKTDKRFEEGDKAHVIVRKNHVGDACNDIGFYIDKTGSSEAFICDYAKKVNKVYNKKVKELGAHGAVFMKRLTQLYSKHVLVEMAKSKNKKMETVELKDGTVKIFVGV